MMRHYFLRNYRMEADFDAEHTRRNLQNIHQDKALANRSGRGLRPPARTRTVFTRTTKTRSC